MVVEKDALHLKTTSRASSTMHVVACPNCSNAELYLSVQMERASPCFLYSYHSFSETFCGGSSTQQHNSSNNPTLGEEVRQTTAEVQALPSAYFLASFSIVA